MTTVHIASKNTTTTSKTPAERKAKAAATKAALREAAAASAPAPAAPAPAPEPAVAAVAPVAEPAPKPRKERRAKGETRSFGMYVGMRATLSAKRLAGLIKRLRQSPVEQAQEVADLLVSASETLYKAAPLAEALPRELRPKAAGGTVGTGESAWEPAAGDKVQVRRAPNVRKQYEDVLTAEQMDALTVVAIRGKWIVVDAGDGSKYPPQIRRAHLIRCE